MKKRICMVLVGLSAAALAGGKWMQAQDQPAGQQRASAPPPRIGFTEEPGTFPAVIEVEKRGTGTEPAAPPLFGEAAGSSVPNNGAPGTATDPFDANRFADSSQNISDLLNKHSAQNVTLEWVGPVQIKVGRPFVYELVVRNIGSIAASSVIVHDKFPEGMRIHSVEPKGVPETDGYVWQIGTLLPQQERRIKIRMTAERKGDVVCHATVTATTPASAKFRVSEPKLVIKQESPEKAMLGDVATITVAVSNPGDGPAENVVIRSALSEGLKHDKGREFTYELGALAGGETRTIQIVCTTTKGGQQSVRSVATAEAGSLISEAESITLVTEPKISISVAGPRRRYLDRGATYTVEVGNPGDAPANNIKVSAQLPPGFKYVDSSNGGRHDFTTRTVAWYMGTLKGGEKRQVAYRCVAVKIGDQKHLANAIGHRGLKADAEIITGVEGISALLLEVVDIDDPVEVGADTAYEIRVTNQGSREATNVSIVAVAPQQMVVRGGQGPTNYRTQGQEVSFTPLPKLAPKAVAIYRIFVRGSSIGDARFQARLNSDSLTEPVIEEESTKVYDD